MESVEIGLMPLPPIRLWVIAPRHRADQPSHPRVPFGDALRALSPATLPSVRLQLRDLEMWTRPVESRNAIDLYPFSLHPQVRRRERRHGVGQRRP
jgi:hypothetical protein